MKENTYREYVIEICPIWYVEDERFCKRDKKDVHCVEIRVDAYNIDEACKKAWTVITLNPSEYEINSIHATSPRMENKH